jgi:large subunit ribosomal protein L10
MAEQDYKPKINARNKFFLDKLRKLSKENSIIGVVDVTGLPAPQFQRIRAALNKTAKVLIVKKNLIELVLNELEKERPGISALFDKVKESGIVGLVFTNDNPFSIYKFIQKNKSSAPAKEGQVAPNDIVVPAGPTSFAPGPIIGELGALKIKAGINAGKVEIKEDTVVAKEGDVISGPLASILSRLGIEPMEVGLNVKAVYESGIIYDKKVLDVDEEAILNDLKSEANRSFKLSVEIGYICKDNIEYMISKAARDSLGLAIGIDYISKDTIDKLLSKANAQATGVALSLPEDIRPAGVKAVVASPVSTNNVVDNEGSKKEDKKEEPATDAAAGLGSLF